MRRIFHILALLLLLVTTGQAQTRIVQNRPYTDLRQLHFGILVGLHLQDIGLKNVGPQLVEYEDGTLAEKTIVCENDRWNAGFSVGVLADLRLSKHFNVRFTPTMHFGAKHLFFYNMTELTPEGRPVEMTQDMKSTYISFPVGLKFSAERWNNYRPYVIAGANQLINLTSKNQDFLQLKRTDTMLEIGLGCDLYLPFFKLIPELKFCYSLTDALDKDHVNELQDTNKRLYANAVRGAQTKMIVLTFYFE